MKKQYELLKYEQTISEVCDNWKQNIFIDNHRTNKRKKPFGTESTTDMQGHGKTVDRGGNYE